MRSFNCYLSCLVWQACVNNWWFNQVVMIFVESILNWFLRVRNRLLLNVFACVVLVRELSITWSCWIKIIVFALCSLFCLLELTFQIFPNSSHTSFVLWLLLLNWGLRLLKRSICSKIWHLMPLIKLLTHILMIINVVWSIVILESLTCASC